jgi:hypothetical protein
MVTEKHSFVYLQRGPFPQSTFVPYRGEYDLECQSVAVATEELFSEQGVDKKVKDLEKKRKAMRAKGLFIGEAAVRWKKVTNIWVCYAHGMCLNRPPSFRLTASRPSATIQRII